MASGIPIGSPSGTSSYQSSTSARPNSPSGTPFNPLQPHSQRIRVTSFIRDAVWLHGPASRPGQCRSGFAWARIESGRPS
jgi:hypothetical protein